MALSASTNERKKARLPLLGMARHGGGHHSSHVVQSLQGSARLVLPELSTSSWYVARAASALAGTVLVICLVRTPDVPSMRAAGLTHLHRVDSVCGTMVHTSATHTTYESLWCVPAPFHLSAVSPSCEFPFLPLPASLTLLCNQTRRSASKLPCNPFAGGTTLSSMPFWMAVATPRASHQRSL